MKSFLKKYVLIEYHCISNQTRTSPVLDLLKEFQKHGLLIIIIVDKLFHEECLSFLKNIDIRYEEVLYYDSMSTKSSFIKSIKHIDSKNIITVLDNNKKDLTELFNSGFNVIDCNKISSNYGL